MNRIITTASSVASSKSVTFWKEVGTGSPTVSSMTSLTGPNEAYIVQGSGSVYRVYQMDWTTDTQITTSAKDIDVGANAERAADTFIQSDSDFNIVVGTKTVLRFNAQPGGGIGFDEYTVTKTGHKYSQKSSPERRKESKRS